jgi:hypothetical protein
MKYRVTYTFGATILVDADSEDAAIEQVEEMDDDELIDEAISGFEIQNVEEV